MKNLIILFVSILSIMIGYESSAQSMTKVFKNSGQETIELYKGNTLLGSILQSDDKPFSVNLGDKITVKVPGNTKLTHPPIYINEVNTKKVRIYPKIPYISFDSRIKKEGVLDFALNSYGIDLLEYNPMAAVGSFKSGQIFQGLTDKSIDYKPSAGKMVVDGFTYTGTNLIGKGENSEQVIVGVDNFQQKWSIGANADVPIPKTPATVGIDFSYAEMKQHNLKTTDIFFTSNEEQNVYSVALSDLDDVILADGFIDDVEDLDPNNPADARDFIAKYGTHYPKNLIYGGHYNSYVVISESDYYSAESKDLDIGASVKLSKPGKQTQELKSPTKIETTGSTGSSSAGGGGINFSLSTKRETQDILNNSINKYYFVGGNGNFDQWTVDEGNAVAIDIEPAYMWRLLYPSIVKTSMTEAQLAPKRIALKNAIDLHLKGLKEIKKSPRSRAFKFKLQEIKVLDHSDDLNRNVKGNITAMVTGLKQAKTIKLWDRPSYSNDIKGDLFTLDNRTWHTVKQESDINGNFKPISIRFSGSITEKDDWPGEKDDDKMTIEGSPVFDLNNINGMKDYKFKLKHSILSGTQRFTVEATIRAIPFLGFGDGTLARPATRSATRSATVVNSQRPGGSVKASTGASNLEARMANAQPKGTGVPAPPPAPTPPPAVTYKEVKFYQQNGITMAQANALAAQQGAKLATAQEVSEAWQHLKLDVYAFGMMADGRFAVPVQSDHSNFKIGANVGASGGNQGFFYTGSTITAPVAVAPPPTPVAVAPPPPPAAITPTGDGFKRIQNNWYKNNYVHNQNSKIEQGPIQAGWWSAQWKILPVHSGWVRIQNKWYPDQYLHNQNGKLEVGPIQPNWASAMWKLVPAHSGWVRIQNSWYKDHYIHNQNGQIELGPIQPNWASALWKVE